MDQDNPSESDKRAALLAEREELLAQLERMEHAMQTRQAFHHQLLLARLKERANRAGFGFAELNDGTFVTGTGGKVFALPEPADVERFLDLAEAPTSTEH